MSGLSRDEAENIVEKFWPVTAITEIFSQDEKFSSAKKGPFNEEKS